MQTNVSPGNPWILLGGILLLIILLGLLVWWRAHSRASTDRARELIADPPINPNPRGPISFKINPDGPNVHIVRNDQDQVIHVEHIREFTQAADAGSARALAARYVTDNIALFDPTRRLALALDQPVEDRVDPDASQGLQLRFAAQKSIKETTVVSYVQTLHGVRIDRAGLSVVVNMDGPAQGRVTSAQNSLHDFVEPPQALEDASRVAAQKTRNDLRDSSELARRLGLDRPQSPFRVAAIHGTPGLLYHRYDPGDRLGGDPVAAQRAPWQPLVGAPPPLPLPEVPPNLTPGRHYLVADARFMLLPPNATDERVGVNWRAFFEVHSRRVLYIRPAMASCFDTIFPPDAGDAVSPCSGDLISADGKVFALDPMTRTGQDPFDPTIAHATVGQFDGILDDLTTPVALKNVVATTPKQRLEGKWVRINDTDAPIDDQPIAKALLPPHRPYDLNYKVRQHFDDFTAVNAYYHCDAMFRMLAQLNLLLDLFPTCQTIDIDHMALSGEVNAIVLGNSNFTAANRIYFGRARRDPWTAGAIPIGNAADPRIVMHEFCHVLLLASTHWPMLDFAHSAGDSLAAILNDPCSALTGEARYETFPWILRENPDYDPLQGRHHGGNTRQCTALGWCWGGQKDLDDRQPTISYVGYDQERLRPTPLFRVYQVAGGDARPAAGDEDAELQEIRCFAARYLAYLIIRAIGSLPYRDDTPTFTADAFATALMEADTHNPVFNDRVFGAIPGGTLHKVIRWSFEQQGLYQQTPAPNPVIAPARPAVDVYVGPDRDDYLPYRQDIWETTDLWNRRAPNGIPVSAPPPPHENARAGQANFAYLRVRNRGYAPATSVEVRGYYRRIAPGLSWESGGAWTPMAPAVLNVPGQIAANGVTDPLGPFTWNPPALQNPAQPETWCLLFSVSAEGDESNIDPDVTLPCKSASTPLRRLVPFDNNLAAREVTAVALP
jgi:hypothetical protein